MPKTKIRFVCQKCGAQYPKWQGQCIQCGQWNSLVEEIEEGTSTSSFKKEWSEAEIGKIVHPYSQVKAVKGSKKRFSSAIGELDRVLGGGIVPGSMNLIGGEPGIGKSTLLTQMVLAMIALQNKNQKEKSAKKKQTKEVFGSICYVCGEESPSQISLRTERIINNEQFLSTYGFGKNSSKLSKLLDKSLKFVTTTNVDQLIQFVRQEKPSLVIVDSIQTLTTQDLTGASGSVGQVREATDRLVQVGKQLGIAMFLVGHVTKTGTIAGPKTLEHIVDSVLELSGERTGQFRMIRALKNRFGATDEVGVFKLVDYGLEEVLNPSELFIESEHGKTPGSAITCVMEGTRPLLIEVQALVNKSHLPMPRRVGRGIDLSRIQVLSAVLQKHCHLPMSDHDVFLSAAGGFRVKEPSVDLGLAVAIVGSLKERVLSKKTVFIGEVGLLGEIRPVTYLDRRIKEAKRLGFEQIISSKNYHQVRAVIGKFFK